MKDALAVILYAVSITLSAGVARAQRTDFVYHVYVDPIYGDDRLAEVPPNAWNFNPQPGLGQSKPLDDHVADASWTTLQHAPYSFKTLTAAVRWLRSFMNHSSQPLGSMPWSLTGNKRVVHCLVHCLPGLYGPGGEVDPRSGLRWNGETFPINLPEFVSIQGAGALDTIFDAQEMPDTSVFIVSAQGNDDAKSRNYSTTFIDGVTIRGARGKQPGGAGVAIWAFAVSGSTFGTQLVISNCVITNCTIGIAVDGPRQPQGNDPLGFVNSPVIVNNTIAWNQIGVWSGSFQESPTIGRSRPRLYNNIIDSDDPYGVWGGVQNTSGFEGLDVSDLTISSKGGNPVGVDFNAYEAAHVNRQSGLALYPVGWPRTAPRSMGVYSPRVDVDAYTMATRVDKKRNVLYVRDLLVAALGGGPRGLSPHDFRLAPDVGESMASDILNPLVNKGTDHVAGALRFANYYAVNPALTPDIVRAPGLPGPGSQASGAETEYASINASDWDSEGFGNFRVYPRAGFPAPPLHSTYIDIGADEMGDLIVAGYIDSTRIFSRDVPGANAISDHSSVYFVELPPALAGTSLHRRPFFSYTLGGRVLPSNQYRWWDWAQGTSMAARFSYASVMYNYTVGEFATYRFTGKAGAFPGSAYQPFMRNLECDVSPYVIADIHPFWAIPFSSLGPDEFSSNSWVNHASSVADNHYLYYKPTHAQVPSAVLESTINPPATWLWSAQAGFIGLMSPLIFDPGGSNQLLVVNGWGIGDVVPGPDVIPDSDYLGVRFNLERPDTSYNFGQGNLQSFLAVKGASAMRQGQGASVNARGIVELTQSLERLRESLRGRFNAYGAGK